MDPFPLLTARACTQVVEAKALSKSSDYSAEVFLDDEKQARTRARAASCEPYWNQTFLFDAVPKDVAKVVVQVVRYDLACVFMCLSVCLHAWHSLS